MNVLIDCQNMIDSECLPSVVKMQRWTLGTLKIVGAKLSKPEVTIRVVSIK